MINPSLVFEAGRKTVSMAKQAGGAVMGGGNVVNGWLKEQFPLESPEEKPSGGWEFPHLNIPVSEHLDHKIKLLENTAKALEVPEYVSMVKSIIEQINDDSFTVLFAGCFNTGKSTLLNKLLERNILKTRNGETTKTLAWLQYAAGEDKEWACYHDFQDNMHKITLEKIASIPEDPPVFNVFAGVHADILKHGALLIDTPGLEASEEAAALTEEAVKNADAVILVTDNYPPAKHDKRFIEMLQKTGKTEKLFVVVNKIDEVPLEEREGFIASRRNMLSEMGVSTRIFALSCKDEAAAPGAFEQFRTALEQYINTGLQAAREAAVSRRIGSAAKTLQARCKEAVEFSRVHDAQERAALRDSAHARIREVEREVERVIRSNQSEIRRLEGNILDKWSNLYGNIQDEVNIQIQHATSEQLNHPNQLLGGVQNEINNFLLKEFSDAENQIRNSITRALDGVQLPMPRQEGGHLTVTGLVPWDKNFKIPAEFGTLGMLAYTFFTRAHGFFGTIACVPNLYLIFILSPFINKIFEQLVKAGMGIGTSVFKTQLQKKINAQFPAVDEHVRKKSARIVRRFRTRWSESDVKQPVQ
ncbi:MAG: dynamin family protein [Treponema sp.]|jgi:small GTP-binding protein|nr:dynamin family protein [Treponema sp.]